MAKLETCCCCCSLECGGSIIGWMNAILSGIIAVVGAMAAGAYVLAIVFVARGMFYVEGIEHFSLIPLKSILYFILLLAISGLMLYSAIKLIKGVTNRDPAGVKPMMIFDGVLALLVFLPAVTVDPKLLTIAVISALIALYWVWVLYSLRHKFLSEKSNGFGNGANMQPMQQTVIPMHQMPMYTQAGQVYQPAPGYPATAPMHDQPENEKFLPQGMAPQPLNPNVNS